MTEHREQFGALPLAALGVTLVLILVFGAVGWWWPELLLVPLTFAIAYVWWEPIVDHVADPADRLAHRTADELWTFARLGRVATAAWSRQGGTEIKVWAKQVPVRRQHQRALRALGHAVFVGDAAQEAKARAWADQTARTLQDFAAQRDRTRAESHARLAHERSVTQPTEQFPVADEAPTRQVVND